MASLNKVQLIGNLGKDPEVHKTQDGRSIVNFSLATAERWRDKSTGERKEKTEWHTIVIFNEALAQVAEKYLKKGSSVYVEGQLQTRKWVDKNGDDRYSTEVVLQSFRGEIVLLGDRSGGRGEQTESLPSKNNNAPKPANKAIVDDLDDSVPF